MNNPPPGFYAERLGAAAATEALCRRLGQGIEEDRARALMVWTEAMKACTCGRCPVHPVVPQQLHLAALSGVDEIFGGWLDGWDPWPPFQG